MITRTPWPEGIPPLPEYRCYWALLANEDWLERPSGVNDWKSADAYPAPVIEVTDGRITYVNAHARILGLVTDEERENISRFLSS